MNALQIFNNPEYGELRTFTEPDGTKLCCGNDVAKVLGYAQPKDAIKRHCKGAVKRRLLDSNGKTQLTTFIPEGDVYRLMHKAADQSNNPDIKERAEKFGGWIFDDVLPKINRDGAYITDRADPAALRQKADELESVAALNDMAQMLMPMFDDLGMQPAFKLLAMKQIYRRAGIDLPMGDLKAERELYDLCGIAKKSGVYSLTGKPHGHAIAAIIRILNVPDSEKELVSFEKQGHMGTTYQYTAKVADMVQEWLAQNNYPETISGFKADKEITFKVSHQAQLTGGK